MRGFDELSHGVEPGHRQFNSFKAALKEGFDTLRSILLHPGNNGRGRVCGRIHSRRSLALLPALDEHVSGQGAPIGLEEALELRIAPRNLRGAAEVNIRMCGVRIPGRGALVWTD